MWLHVHVLMVIATSIQVSAKLLMIDPFYISVYNSEIQSVAVILINHGFMATLCMHGFTFKLTKIIYGAVNFFCNF